jgi:hypothetical protein
MLFRPFASLAKTRVVRPTDAEEGLEGGETETSLVSHTHQDIVVRGPNTSKMRSRDSRAPSGDAPTVRS